DQRTEHQLQDGSLAERIRDDLEATAFLNKEAFKQIRRPDGPPTAIFHASAPSGPHRTIEKPRAFMRRVGHQ
ncbi:MAG: hypothetical protein WBW73_18420, partial [Rhodoplanes sp.]